MAQEDIKYDEPIESEKWSPTGNRATFDGNIVKFTNSDSVYGTKLISSGKHEWKIKSTFSSRSCQWIGVASDFTVLNTTFTKKPNSFLWCNACKYIQGNIGQGHKNIIPVKEMWDNGDCITIKLDIDAKTISWYKNSDAKPVATYSNVPTGKYKIAVYGYSNNTFEIISSDDNNVHILSIENEILPKIRTSMDNLKQFEAKKK
eukprot:332405_1